jgi:hypothetical protein
MMHPLVPVRVTDDAAIRTRYRSRAAPQTLLGSGGEIYWLDADKMTSILRMG